MSENDHAKVRVILDLDSIATKVTEMGATPFWSDLFRLIATEKGFGNGPQKVVFANYPDSVVVGMGEFADDDYEPEVKRFKVLDREMTYTTFSDGIVFQIPTNPEQTNDLPEPIRCSTWSQWTDTIKKETEMSNEQKPTDTDLIWKKFREQLEAAKLSEQSIGVIMRTLRDDTGLKKPTTESVLLCTKSRNVTNVFYSHTGKPVTLTDAEDTYAFEDGETLSYGAGHHDAFFIADTSKVKTFEEKMIHRHVGVPKIALHLSNGKSIELPFKKEYIKVTEGAVMIHLDCSVGVSLTNKELNSLTGWALTDLNEVEKSRFFVNGREYTVEEFNEKINPRKQEGAVNPGAGSWADIE